MNYTYEEKTTSAPIWTYIQRSDGALIPIDPANSDYRAYLEHLTENPTEDVE